MTRSLNRFEVALKLPTSANDLLIRAQAIVDAMTDNPWFPSPVPSLATVQAAIDALAQAQTAMQDRTRGAATVRDAKRRVLAGLLKRLAAYVEGIAEENPENSRSIAQSAMMDAKDRTPPNKPLLAVRSVKLGEVAVSAKAAGKHAVYEWEWREDGTTEWNAAGKTTQANTVIRGLPVGKMVWFRFRAVTPAGEQDWVEPVGIIVR